MHQPRSAADHDQGGGAYPRGAAYRGHEGWPHGGEGGRGLLNNEDRLGWWSSVLGTAMGGPHGSGTIREGSWASGTYNRGHDRGQQRRDLCRHLSRHLSRHLGRHLGRHLSRDLSRHLGRHLSRHLSRDLGRHLGAGGYHESVSLGILMQLPRSALPPTRSRGTCAWGRRGKTRGRDIRAWEALRAVGRGLRKGGAWEGWKEAS